MNARWPRRIAPMSDKNLLLLIEFALLMLVFVPTMVAFLGGAPWVPTPTVRVKKMLELAKIKPGQKVYDIGCGDGRMVILASKLYKADAVGIELSPLLYLAARIRNFLTGGKAHFVLRNMHTVNLGDADVLMFYLMPETLAGMRKKFLKELKPGTKLVSYAFSIKDWEPTHLEPKDPKKNLARILIYTIGKSEHGGQHKT